MHSSLGDRARLHLKKKKKFSRLLCASSLKMLRNSSSLIHFAFSLVWPSVLGVNAFLGLWSGSWNRDRPWGGARMSHRPLYACGRGWNVRGSQVMAPLTMELSHHFASFSILCLHPAVVVQSPTIGSLCTHRHALPHSPRTTSLKLRHT